MRREEAMKIATGLCTDFKCKSDTMVDFCNTIIKVLEQEPCKDCVSREELFNLLTRNYSGYRVAADGSCVPGYYREDIYDEIKALPSVIPTHKKGKWIKQNNDYFDWYECSECGYGSEGEMRYSREYDVRTNYCPNCGVKMENC